MARKLFFWYGKATKYMAAIYIYNGYIYLKTHNIYINTKVAGNVWPAAKTKYTPDYKE